MSAQMVGGKTSCATEVYWSPTFSISYTSSEGENTVLASAKCGD